MADLDDLMAAFAGVNVDDHDELVETFARVLGTDGGSARFFLEASQWNLEVALGNFLDTVGSRVRDRCARAPAPSCCATRPPPSRAQSRAPRAASQRHHTHAPSVFAWRRATSRVRAASRGRSSRGMRRCSRSGPRPSRQGSRSRCSGRSSTAGKGRGRWTRRWCTRRETRWGRRWS